MSRTYKDKRPRKYRKGYCWLNDEYNGKIERRRIKRYNPASGGAYRKLGNKLDRYCGM